MLKSSYVADALWKILRGLQSKEFEDGVFSQGDIEYTRRVKYEEIDYEYYSEDELLRLSHEMNGKIHNSLFPSKTVYRDETEYLRRPM
jgi:hypothetical protein